jgi:bifunctional N-acetylglucosamine-1-phosphate-uridyltransferase/glucosamine-1-phosphate-acetyltransferase GlmU-like protein
MEKNSQDFSIKKAQQLAQTREGQQLMHLLQQKDAAELQKAMDAANSGNYKQAGTILSSLLSSPEAQKLIRQLGDHHG